ncbi:hypothetical protein SBI_09513 [Streptomyces bingchenggensis BCW-1]|uniref:Uncharacterized protein n=1 Tax=Streptomyces bingchenggensis (strain BCW-1) TaxID=749414 RepID=D7C7T3_STRBB|nr:hypothetical protein [Streptomyces milbemycinicus]ADI12631.1 hypothetical protein SBI_09513 [Streptomyces bingchenggensis BCW-1]
MHQGGFALQIPKPELYYGLLKAHYVKIHPRRGVKIGGLWYHDEVPDAPASTGHRAGATTGSERVLAPLIPALPPQLRHRRHWGSIASCLATPRPNTHTPSSSRS